MVYKNAGMMQTRLILNTFSKLTVAIKFLILFRSFCHDIRRIIYKHRCLKKKSIEYLFYKLREIIWLQVHMNLISGEYLLKMVVTTTDVYQSEIPEM